MTEVVDVDGLDRWLRDLAALVHDRREELTRLDSAIGDADHGANLDRGFGAVVAALDDAAVGAGEAGTGTPFDGPGDLLKKAGMTLVSKVGGASGPLYGTFFLRMGTAAGARATLDPAAFAACLRAGLDGVVARGKAQPGDKTMVDALAPALDALDTMLAAHRPLGDALRAARTAAEVGRDATTAMLARKGRASYLGERSVGHQDPGATSAALLVAAAAGLAG